MQDFYIIAVYTAHCSVYNQNYLIAIVNNDKYQQSGLRFILRPNEFLYNIIIDKLESQNIYPCFDDFNEYILSYPFELGKGEIYDFNRLNIDINSLYLSRKILDNNFIVLNPSEGDIYKHNPMISYLKNTYSLELYSLFCKGNYIYSSLQYQKRAIKELITMIRNDFDTMVENYLNKSYCELIADNITSELTGSQYRMEQKLKIKYPTFNKTINLNPNETPNFYYGFAIVQDYRSNYYGIIDIKGNTVVDLYYENILPLKIVKTTSDLNNYKLYTYAEANNLEHLMVDDEQFENERFKQIVIYVNNNSFETSIKERYKKVFRYKDYDLLYFYSPNDDDYDEDRYYSCTVFINKGLEYIRDYDNIKDIDETGKDGYFLVKKVNSDDLSEKGIYNNPIRNEALGLVKIDDFGRFKSIISVSRCYYRIQHITEKYWIVWGREDFDMNCDFYYDEKHLEYEKYSLAYDDMSAGMIEDSIDARIFHEDRGFLTNYGQYQSYTTAEYESEKVIVLYSGEYFELHEDEPWLEKEYGYHEEEFYCYCFDMNCNLYKVLKDDPDLKRHDYYMR